MSKSTPISQLPHTRQQEGFSVENAPPTRMAQALTNSPPPPQNTQQNEITDDDQVVQDILNNMASSSDEALRYTPEIMPRYEQPAYMPPIQQPPLNNTDILLANLAQRQAAMENISLRHYVTVFASDIKLATLVFFVVIAVHFIPFEAYLSKYIALDKIPYHDIVVKALIIAGAVIVIKKVVLKM